MISVLPDESSPLIQINRLLYITATSGEPGKVDGAVVTLSSNGTYQKHENVKFNDGACYLSLDGDNKHLLGVSYGNGRLNVYPLDERGRPGKAITTVDEGKREAHTVSWYRPITRTSISPM